MPNHDLINYFIHLLHKLVNFIHLLHSLQRQYKMNSSQVKGNN